MTTCSLKQIQIKGIELSKKLNYLYVSFKDGSIEIYDLGDNFSSKPMFMNIQKYEM